jgi:hypothetical protein
MVRTASKLREQGARVVVLDLTAIGQNLTPEQWYDGLITRVGRQLKLEKELRVFWQANLNLSPVQRFFTAIRDVAMGEGGVSGKVGEWVSGTGRARHSVRAAEEGEKRGKGEKEQEGFESRFTDHESRITEAIANRKSQIANPLIVFIDEIDTVQSLPFSTDEFFAAIRECYNRRTEDAVFDQLTFCLLGVATPSDLIRDTRTTPFNIGRRIELNDFTFEEAAPLAAGLAHSAIRTPRSALEPLRTPSFAPGEEGATAGRPHSALEPPNSEHSAIRTPQSAINHVAGLTVSRPRAWQLCAFRNRRGPCAPRPSRGARANLVRTVAGAVSRR